MARGQPTASHQDPEQSGNAQTHAMRMLTPFLVPLSLEGVGVSALFSPTRLAYWRPFLLPLRHGLA